MGSLKFLVGFIAGFPRRLLRAWQERRLPRSLPQLLQLARRQFRYIEEHFRSRGIRLHELLRKTDPYVKWQAGNRLTPKLLERMNADARKLAPSGPRISVVVPVFNTPQRLLWEAIESVKAQIYPNWELCLADDASTDPHVREVLEQARLGDSRVKVTYRSRNGHICEATNSALESASGDYVALLDHDDLLSRDALLHVAECIAAEPGLDWIYTDEDKIGLDDIRYGPQFKGGWNPEMAITHNYTHHLSVIRRILIDRAGRMRVGFEGAQDLDLFLRVAELTGPERIRHVPQVCYHWRSHAGSTASHGAQKDYIFKSAHRAISEALVRRKLKADPELSALAKQYGMCLYQLKWRKESLPERAVTIVIPTRDRVDLLERCVRSLQVTVPAGIAKLVIVDDHSSETRTQKYLAQLQREGVLACRVIPATGGDGGFNYARLVNSALPHVDTPYVMHLNNDVLALETGWIEDLLGWMSVPGVGAVGARLVYPDGKIQHAGIVVGPHHGLADHLFHSLPVNEVGYLALPHAARNAAAVTGACFVTRTDLYRELGGFDEANFGVEYNDVDFCLRLAKRGMRIVCSPQATLTHVTRASRSRDHNPQEHVNFLRRYPGFRDLHFNENLSLDSMLMGIDPNHFSHARRMSGLKIVLISHNLDLGGAQIVTYEIGRHYAAHGNHVTVLSPKDGPIRRRYEALGIAVRILDPLPMLNRISAQELGKYLQAAGDSHDLSSADLVVSNTVTAFWGVELAHLFSVPAVWHIHESTRVAAYTVDFEKSMRELVRSTFGKSNRIVFQSRATRELYGDVSEFDNFTNIPGGVPIERIEAFLAAHPKSGLRAKYSIDEDALVVTLPGTTCERKGQHLFVEAIADLVKAYDGRFPRKMIFVMVGGRAGSYIEYLRSRIAKLKQVDIRLFDETEDIYDFFALSDIFVCASFEESFPMVVLLAMAFKLSVVSTDVNGIPEMITNGAEGRLVGPGDPVALSAALRECLQQPDASVKMARYAYAKVCRLFNQTRFLDAELALARAVAAEEAIGDRAVGDQIIR